VDVEPALKLSIVIPAYNEAGRLPSTLDAVRRYLEDRQLDAEVIVVDDGSIDGTARVARHAPGIPRLRVIELPHRGKASAVREGMLAAEGEVVLFTDADLSTPLSFTQDLMVALKQGADVAIGSREGVGAQRVGEPAYRHLMGRVFNAVVRALAVPGINDTQCGFKAFRVDVARDLFSRALLYTDGETVTGPRVTGFDVEILFLARRCGYRIAEVPVYWQHVSGSKVRPIQDAVRMFADVARVRLNAARGRYDRVVAEQPG
jgi:glycosyltransferase involved in cell wall biosynthesis